MIKKQTITVFGANGSVGRHFIQQALNEGYTLRGFVRDRVKFEEGENLPIQVPKIDASKIEIIEGDATNEEDVARGVAGSDLIVSCLGSSKTTQIMYSSHDNILKAASTQSKIPRCLLISSIGCSGTSWIIKTVITLMGEKGAFADYEKADRRILEEKTVPFLLFRPHGLTNREGTGEYYVTQKQRGTFLRPISRSDLAKFILDGCENLEWDGRPGVLIGGAKA